MAELNFHRTGTGEPLLLLHGIGMQWEWWTPCLDELSTRFEVLAVDFAGFGDSAPLPPGIEPNPAAHADSIERLLEHLGAPPPNVAGISMGGLVALELAKRGAVRSVCAISPAGFATGWQRRYLDASLRATSGLVRALAPRAPSVVATGAGRLATFAQVCNRGDRIPADAAAGFLRSTARSDFARTRRPLVAWDFTGPVGPDVPVTIAWGSGDRLLLPGQADLAVSRIPGARRVDLPGCGHVPTYDDPARVAATVRIAAGA